MCSHLPQFIEPQYYPLSSSDLKPVEFLVWATLQQKLQSQKIRNI